MVRLFISSVLALVISLPAWAGNWNSGSDEKQIFPGHETQIPPDLDYRVNDKTLEYYFLKQDSQRIMNPLGWWTVNPTNTPYSFESKLQKNPVIEAQLKTKSIFSYIYYDNGSIVYDYLPPSGRFSIPFSEGTYFESHSMGKSIVSYLIGHAICKGYIDSVDSKIGDWPIMETTLYYGQPLINLLNMQSGDTTVIKPKGTRFIKSGRHIHGQWSLLSAASNEKELMNTKPAKSPRFAYSNLTSDVLMSYLMHRVGADFEEFINNFYQNHIGIKYPVFLKLNPITSFDWSIENLILEGAGQYGISATRYDFLRIAVAIMNDWQKDTCEGKYLKNIYSRAVKTNNKMGWNTRFKSPEKDSPTFGQTARRYAGQFWIDFPELKDTVMAMVGADGQQIIMNMDKSRIVVIAAGQQQFYDSKKLGLYPIKSGKVKSSNWN